MLYTIKSAQASATISSLGAELQSLRHLANAGDSSDKQGAGNNGGHEAIWHGDPAVWSGRAPILFPIVGALKNNQYMHEGKTFTLSRHGFARQAEFTCTAQSANSIALQLQANPDSLSVYPWDFELTIGFTIEQEKLLISYRVVNRDTTPMLFTVGSHPAFALQHAPDEYAIYFSKAETLKHHPLTSDGLLTPGVDYLRNTQQLPLTETLFDDDALIFKNIQSNAISLHHRDKPVVTVNTGGAPHLGIWAKPAARFVCIEPWFGYSDDADGGGALIDKPQMTSLPEGKAFTYEWDILLHQQ